MKNYKYLFGLMLLAAFFLFGGCYTQLAVRERVVYERQQFDNYDDEYDTTDNYSDTDTEYYDENDNQGVTVYDINYDPVFPSYRRYFWSYYPSVTIGAYFGSYYYNSYCCDPFNYWAWCYNPWYSPYYSYQYNWWSGYYPGYNYGYYGSGWAYDGNIYKTRSNNGYRIRNNDGLRGNGGGRGIVTRGGGRDGLNKTEVRNTDVTGRTLTRDNTGARTGRSNDEITNRNDRTTRQEIINDLRQNSRTKNLEDRNSVSRDRRSSNPNENRKDIKQNTRNERKRSQSPEVKRENRSGRNENGGTYNSGRKSNSNSPRYTPPKRTESTPKSYSPPQRSYSPPRSSAPPQRSSSSSGRSSSGSRNSGNDRRR